VILRHIETVVATSRAWVLLSYRMPRTPSTRRIAVWRKLKRLGVAQLGDGLVALPEDPRTLEQLEWVAADVEAADGTAFLWRAELVASRDEQRVADGLAAARAEEYRNLIDRARGAEGEHGERRRLLEQLRRDLRQVRRRDYFPPAEAELARQTVEELATSLTVTDVVAGSAE